MRGVFSAVRFGTPLVFVVSVYATIPLLAEPAVDDVDTVARNLVGELVYDGESPEEMVDKAVVGKDVAYREALRARLEGFARDVSRPPVVRFALLHAVTKLDPEKAEPLARELFAASPAEVPNYWKADYLPMAPLSIVVDALKNPDFAVAAGAVSGLDAWLAKDPARVAALKPPIESLLEERAKSLMTPVPVTIPGPSAVGLVGAPGDFLQQQLMERIGRTLLMLPEQRGEAPFGRLLESAQQSQVVGFVEPLGRVFVDRLGKKELVRVATDRNQSDVLRGLSLQRLSVISPVSAEDIAQKLLTDRAVPAPVAVSALLFRAARMGVPSGAEVDGAVRLLHQLEQSGDVYRLNQVVCQLSYWFADSPPTDATHLIPLLERLSIGPAAGGSAPMGGAPARARGPQGRPAAAMAAAGGFGAGPGSNGTLSTIPACAFTALAVLPGSEAKTIELLKRMSRDPYGLEDAIRHLSGAKRFYVPSETVLQHTPEVLQWLRDEKNYGRAAALAQTWTNALRTVAMTPATANRPSPSVDVHGIVDSIAQQPPVPALNLELQTLASDPSFPESLRERVSRAVEAPLARLRRENKKPVDACTAVCDLVDRYPQWGSDNYGARVEWNGDWALWNTTRKAIAATFLRQALPYCPKAAGPLAEVEQWIASQPTLVPDVSQMAPPQGAAVDLDTMGLTPNDPALVKAKGFLAAAGPRVPTDANEVYARQFLITFLRGRVAELSPGARRAEEEARLKKLETELAASLAVHDRAPNGVQGSLFNSYAVTTSAMLLPRSSFSSLAAMGALDRVAVDAGDPARVPYSQERQADSAQGGLARSITLALHLYLETPEGAEKERLRARFVSLLERMFAASEPGGKRPVDALLQQFFREGTHAHPNDHHLATYYFYGNLPYWASGAAILLRDEKLAPGQREKLEGLRAKLRDEVLRVRQSDGMFPSGGAMTYFNGPAYVQPLFGMGLVPLIDSCSDGKGGERRFQRPALGILDEALLAGKAQRVATLPISPKTAHDLRQAASAAVTRVRTLVGTRAPASTVPVSSSRRERFRPTGSGATFHLGGGAVRID